MNRLFAYLCLLVTLLFGLSFLTIIGFTLSNVLRLIAIILLAITTGIKFGDK